MKVHTVRVVLNFIAFCVIMRTPITAQRAKIMSKKKPKNYYKKKIIE